MTLTKWQPPALRHEVAEDGRVTWLELFFDLIYVAALIQLGDRLAGDVSWSGVLAFVGSFVLLWWTWTGVTAFMNRFAVDDIPHRVLTFVQMFAVGNVAVLAATNPENWAPWLAVTYVVARLPLLIMYLRVGRNMPEAKPMTQLILKLFAASVVLWLISIVVPGQARYLLWAVALAVEFAAPVMLARRTDSPQPHGEHFQERYALFTIIVMGETFVKTLSEIGDIGITARTQVFGGLAFLILIGLWWTYFDDVADARIRSTSALSSRPATNRLVWVYVHLPLTAAITAFGVAAKKIVGVESFMETFKPSYTWLLVLALATALVAVAILDLVTASPHFAIEAPERAGPRLVAAVVLVAVGALTASGSITALWGIGAVVVTVIVQIAVEVVSAYRSEFRLGREVQSQVEQLAGGCHHIDAAAHLEEPQHPACDLCEAEGKAWVQLRLCLTCGHVSCCDDSPGTHATAHHRETGHPVIVTLEPGDTWAYCYDHEVTDPGWRVTT